MFQYPFKNALPGGHFSITHIPEIVFLQLIITFNI